MLVYLGDIGQLVLSRAWKKELESHQGTSSRDSFRLCPLSLPLCSFFLLPLSETGFLSFSLSIYREKKAAQKLPVLSSQLQPYMKNALVEFNSDSIFLGERI